MSRWFRSEPMEYISLIVNEDAAHDCLADLGKLGVIQFTDVSYFFKSCFYKLLALLFIFCVWVGNSDVYTLITAELYSFVTR